MSSSPVNAAEEAELEIELENADVEINERSEAEAVDDETTNTNAFEIYARWVKRQAKVFKKIHFFPTKVSQAAASPSLQPRNMHFNDRVSVGRVAVFY